MPRFCFSDHLFRAKIVLHTHLLVDRNLQPHDMSYFLAMIRHIGVKPLI